MNTFDENEAFNIGCQLLLTEICFLYGKLLLQVYRQEIEINAEPRGVFNTPKTINIIKIKNTKNDTDEKYYSIQKIKQAKSLKIS